MRNFSLRSYEPELLDRTDIPFPDIRRNMQELEFINAHLGGHRITTKGLKRLLASSSASPGRELLIAEIGCGGGDNLIALHTWCKRHGVRARFLGIDINPHCVAFASQHCQGIPVVFQCADYRVASFKEKPDVIFSSLFCHHFTNDQIIAMLRWMKQNAGIGFFINDLHRHFLAYYAIRLLTSLFSSSYLVKNDAPLSVARGFTGSEWTQLMQSAGIRDYSLNWKWAFRHLIIAVT